MTETTVPPTRDGKELSMIEIGAKLTVEKTVTPELTAQMAGSGMLPVFGTPFMTAMMENAAAGVLQQYLGRARAAWAPI